MVKRTTVFYAFPSQPASVDEMINAAIEELKSDSDIKRNNVRFKPWPEVRVSGKHLVSSIVNNIDRAQIFACDLTFPNRNVSFELGYSIAKFKRVFASLDSSIEGATRGYRALYFNLLGAGYSEYHNSRQLATAFREEHPWRDLEQTILGERYRRALPRPENPTLLYVKPPITSESVLATEEALKESIFGESLIVDDPKDSHSQLLDWYAEKLLTADAVVVHLLGTNQVDQEPHNTKTSLIAGLAYGFRKPLLMLAHEPFETPIDYQDLLKTHSSSKNCVQLVTEWMEGVEAGLPRRRPRRERIEHGPHTNLDLRNLVLGEPVAEHERQTLDDYFVETSTFYRALEGPTTILLGRRGTGKTAIMYGIQAELNRDHRNHVTLIKPAGYETHGLIRILEEIQNKSERGYLIESLWKYLIYSEVASSVEQAIIEMPTFRPRSKEQEAFIEFCEQNSHLQRVPFSERIEKAVSSLVGIGKIGVASEQRARISEELHSTLLRGLRRQLGAVLKETETLAIVIDGLDDPWSPGEHVNHLAELIGGLLGVAQDIAEDFSHSDSRRMPVDARVTVILRSDIFAFIQPLVIEQDKLPIERTIWNDSHLLLRVLEQRLLQGTPSGCTPEYVWSKLFPSDVVGVTTQEFVLRTALPRPRDLIYLVKAAVNNGINRGHDRVEAEDLLTAREQYSQWAFDSIIKEDDPHRGNLQTILYEFANANNKQISKGEIQKLMATVGVIGQDSDFYLDLLCDIGFLAIETNNGYRSSRHEGDRRSMREVAQRRAVQSNRDEMFEINAAFHQVLQLDL